MVAIRLSRTGAKKRPTYRVVVIDRRRARDSRNIEIVGHYNPREDPIEIVLKRERIDYWMGVGAQPSKTVLRLIGQYDERCPPEVPEPAVTAEAPEPETDGTEVAADKPIATAGPVEPGQPTPEESGESWEDDGDAEMPPDPA